MNRNLKKCNSRLQLINILCLLAVISILPVSLYSQTVNTTINLAEHADVQPLNLVVNSETNLIYVLTVISVITINGSTNEIVNKIDNQILFPAGIVHNDITNMIYILDARTASYRVLDGLTNAFISSGPVVENDSCLFGVLGGGLAIDLHPENNLIYLSANTGEDENCKQVIVSDGSNNNKIDSIRGVAPIALAVNSETNQIYGVSGQNDLNVAPDKSIIKIDGKTNEITNSLKLDMSPFTIEIDPRTDNIYIGAVMDNNYSLVVIDSNLENVISKIEIEDAFSGLKINPSSNHLFLANRDSNSVSVIDTLTNEFIKKLEAGNNPFNLDINSKTNKVYVLNIGSASITVINDGIDITLAPTPLSTVTTSPTLSPIVTPTPSATPSPMFTPAETQVPVPDLSPGPSPSSSTIVIDPVTAGSSVLFKDVTVTIYDNKGKVMPDVMIKARSKGFITKVQPETAMTGMRGNAKFRFRFGYVSRDGQISFTTNDGLTAELLQEN